MFQKIAEYKPHVVTIDNSNRVDQMWKLYILAIVSGVATKNVQVWNNILIWLDLKDGSIHFWSFFFGKNKGFRILEADLIKT